MVAEGATGGREGATRVTRVSRARQGTCARANVCCAACVHVAIACNVLLLHHNVSAFVLFLLWFYEFDCLAKVQTCDSCQRGR